MAGTDARFPVSRIWCIGRNYAEHAREMGNDPLAEPPFFFSKPASSVVSSGSELDFPVKSDDVHHEIELVVAIGRGGSNISAAAAPGHVFGYAAGIDLTRRDLQAAAKAAGRPWDLAKGFDESAPIGTILPVSQSGHPLVGTITLEVNGTERQRGDLSDQLWPVFDAIAYLSSFVELLPGDLLMTGTPAGVAALRPGDRVSGRIEGVGQVSFSYRA